MRFANVLTESYSIIICMILALYLILSRDHFRRQKNWFISMLICNIVMALGDMTDWICSGKTDPTSVFLLKYGMIVYFAASAFILFSFTAYLIAYLDWPLKSPLGIISFVMTSFQFLGAITSPWTGLFFYIDEANVYHRGDMFWLSQIVPLIIYTSQFVLIIRERKAMQKQETFFLLSYTILPLLGEVIQVLTYDIALLNLSATLGLLLIFINVQFKQDLKYGQVEAVTKAKTDFFTSMSHEIRTPINVVLGMNEMIIRESNQDNIIEYAQNINVAGKNLLSIINDILDFSKLESDRMEIVPAEYQLSSLVNDLYNLVAERAAQKNLDLSIKLNPKIPNLLIGDERRINQILLNLLTNAVKYTKEGSVELSVDYQEKRATNEVWMIFAVKDTGIGIQKQDLEHVFDSFKRLDQEKNRSIEGTGLGLSIVKKLTDQMQGKLGVESEYGKGSKFSIALPQGVADWEEIGDYTEKILQHKRQMDEFSNKKQIFEAPDAVILAVDDNKMNLRVLEGLLKRTGIRVEKAYSGRECIAMNRGKKYDLILLDHMMPELDGTETLRMLKAEKLVVDIPVIVLTADATMGADEKYQQAGFDGYLTKPVNSDELEKMLMKFLPQEKIIMVNEPI